MKKVSKEKSINPIAWVPSAYFAMGLPFIAVNLVSTFMFKDLGISDTQIAFWTSVIMLPWTLKFLWSPFLEMYRTKKFFVIVTQLLSGLLFGIVALSLNFDYFFAISISTMAVMALSGATHDIACDGVYMAELSPEDQAKYIGVQGAFYNIAKLVANGGLVAAAGMLAEHFGASEGASIQANMPAYKEAWMIIFIIISALLLLLGLYHSKVLPSTQVPNQEKRSSSDVAKELWEVIKNFFTKKHIFYYICFIILYRFAEGFIMKIAPLFLRSSRDIGTFSYRNRHIEWSVRFSCVCFRIIVSRSLRFASRIEENAFHPLLRIQLSIRSLHIISHIPARKSLSDRNRYRYRIFWLWIRIRGSHTLHDATDSAGQTPNVTLRFRFGYYEPRCHASRYDEWIFQ